MDRENPRHMVKANLYRQNHTKSITSILGWFAVYSGIPEMQGRSSWLWRFNLLLLMLLGEISLSLCSQSSWCSASDLTSPLRVGCLRTSFGKSEFFCQHSEVFCRSCSTCRCISGEEGDLHILLLHHLEDLCSSNLNLLNEEDEFVWESSPERWKRWSVDVSSRRWWREAWLEHRECLQWDCRNQGCSIKT